MQANHPKTSRTMGGTPYSSELKNPKARQRRLRRAVIGLDFLALLRFLAKLVWRGDRIRPGLVT